jgi:peptidoglycan/LPS O-acetylase OafA/YrhL
MVLIAASDGSCPEKSYRPNLVGLDIVRVLAMSMVVMQHALSIAGRDDLTLVAGLSIGQLGVAIFLAVSGLLSLESRRAPTNWLAQRLFRVYPAFWIAMVGSFCLAMLSGYKKASVGQIISQMLGTGLWTHSRELVNSPTWFVSLILACYFATFLSRLTQRPGRVALVSSAGLTFLVARDSAPWLLSHSLTYSVASIIAAYASDKTRRCVSVGLATVLIILALLVQPAFAYAAISLIIVESSLLFQTRSRIIKLAAEYSYEFYLIHGVALAGAMTMMSSSPVLAVVAALMCTGVAAVVLNQVAGFIVRLVRPAEQPTDAENSRTARNNRTEAVKAHPPIKALSQM